MGVLVGEGGEVCCLLEASTNSHMYQDLAQTDHCCCCDRKYVLKIILEKKRSTEMRT